MEATEGVKGANGTVLIVDDDPAIRKLLAVALERAGFQVRQAEGYRQCYGEMSDTASVDAVLLDIMLPEVNGLEILRHCSGLDSPPAIVMMTASTDVSDAVSALKLGAFDYLIKPDDTSNLPKLTGVLRNAVSFTRSKREIVRLKRELVARGRPAEIVGTSAPMQRVFEAIRQVADSDASVLITGESGTGKELVAKAIHEASSRSRGPFVVVNCSAIPITLIESELFGHEKGAFTGAIAQKRGKFEIAHGGTIFLDEIGDMDSGSQTRLLRVLQEQAFERVGGTHTINVDVRVIAATNQDLQARVRESAFRLDLFYRIAVFAISLPPLRDRTEDIPLLAAHFLNLHASKAHKEATGFEPAAMNALIRHAWPGNVRELGNVIQHAVIVSEGPTIRLEHLPPHLVQASVPETPAGENAVLLRDPSTHDIRPLKEVEKEVMKRALEATEGNFALAAMKLQIGRATLYRKVKEYGLDADGT